MRVGGEEEAEGPDVVATRRGGGGGAGASGSMSNVVVVASSARTEDAQLHLSPASPEAALTKNQKHRLRQKRCRLAKRLAQRLRDDAHETCESKSRRSDVQGDSTDDPFIVADVRTPTAAAVALPSPSLSEQRQKQQPQHPPAVLLSGSGMSTQDAVAMDSCGGLGAGAGGGERGGSGGGKSGNSSERQGEGEEEANHDGPFPRSRHRRFDDDDGEEEDDSRKRKREENGEEDDDDGNDDDVDGKGERLSLAPSSRAAAPCRVDLSFAAATISVSLERLASGQARGADFFSSSRIASASAPSSAASAGAAPRGNYARYYGYRLRFRSSPSTAAGAAATEAAAATAAAAAAAAAPPLARPPPPAPTLSPSQLALYGPGAADPRLAHLLPYLGLLRGRRLLDVGCNGGLTTLAVASAAGVSSALGVDVDGRLVRSAREACRRVRWSARELERSLRSAREAPRSAEEGGRELLLPEPGGRSLAGRRAAARGCARALASTEFRLEDFVNCGLELGGEEGMPPAAASLVAHFGAALCLSVTKWIHLRDGDEGVLRLFERLSRCLSRGAHLVLEPQPWKSYRRAVRKRGVRETLLLRPSSGGERDDDGDGDDAPRYRSLSSLKIRPEDFVSLLEEERFGFKLVRSLGAPAGAAPGFDRPLLLFRKK